MVPKVAIQVLVSIAFSASRHTFALILNMVFHARWHRPTLLQNNHQPHPSVCPLQPSADSSHHYEGELPPKVRFIELDGSFNIPDGRANLPDGSIQFLDHESSRGHGMEEGESRQIR